MDRVKSAIFSSLGNVVVNARVLDLFAGAGGLGIEALSRGAASALFVEADRHAARAIEQNLATARLGGQVRTQDVFDFLRQSAGSETFDLIFADPPYERTAAGASFTELLLENEKLRGALVDDGLLVLEKRPGEPVSKTIPWQIIRRKTYGATEVIFLSSIPV